MKRIIFILVIIWTIILQADIVSAWFVNCTLKELAETSPLIITGQVIKVSTNIEAVRDHQVVFTYVTIETDMVLQGEKPGSTLSIKMLGGRVGEKGTWSELWQQFKPDEEVLVFLHPKDKANNIWEIKGISSKLSIVNLNGTKRYDCSMLRADEVSQYDSNPYFEKNVIIDRISGYIQAKNGGK